MAEADVQTLSGLLVGASGRLREAAAARVASSRPGGQFRRHVVPALATVETMAQRQTLEPVDIGIVLKACADAAAACRTEPPDADAAALTAQFEDVAAACRAALGEPAQPAGWQRFLFRDADLEVRRHDRQWQVRATTGQHASDTFLDVALERVLPLPGHRLAELTVQILDWFEQHAPFAG